MDIYQVTLDFLLDLPRVREWAELQEILSRAVEKRPRDWQLPAIACQAVGGGIEQAIPAAAAVACLQISIILIDDMLDSDPRGEYHRRGMPVTSNLAAAFQAAGLEAITHTTGEKEPNWMALSSLNSMLLATCLGQHLDMQNPSDEAGYWRLVRTKSSPFFGAALQAGALLGGASAEVAAQIQRLGHLYGEMIQIHDDLNDTMAVPANPDWIQKRASLPILYAMTVEHPERARFREICRAIPDPDALREAQAMLIRCGAVSYGVDLLLRRYQEGRSCLANIKLIRAEKLESLLDEVIDPVRKLFLEIDATLPELDRSLII